MGDPGRLQATARDARRGSEAGARRRDRASRAEPADTVRRLRRSRARPSHERRDGRVPRVRFATSATSWRARTRPRRPSSRSPTCSTEELELAFDHLQIVRDAIERVRVELDFTGIATAFVGTTFTMAELRAVYEAIWGVRARRRELPAERRCGGRLGDPDRAPGSARLGRRPARGALSGRAGVGTRRSDPSIPARGEEVIMKAVVYDRYGPPEVLQARGGRAAGSGRTTKSSSGSTPRRSTGPTADSQAPSSSSAASSPASAGRSGGSSAWSWPARSRRSAQQSPSSRSVTTSSASRATAHTRSSSACGRPARSPTCRPA